ncbi:uncharacterized protein LOC143238452 isoform X2 [Tachypleus tridentatus]|uniref:uncharacterized protein LOC143238452 isoform X2 n=1 Tax=Tachypleus tridentatus TaxID=6853 RepID=UPI003FD686CD
MLGKLVYSCFILICLLSASDAVYHNMLTDESANTSNELRNHPVANYIFTDGTPFDARVREFIPVGLKRKRDHTLQKLLNLLKKVADNRQKPVHIVGKHMRFGISKK